MYVTSNIDKAACLILAGVKLELKRCQVDDLKYEFRVIDGSELVKPALDRFYSDAPVPLQSFLKARYMIKEACRLGRKNFNMTAHLVKVMRVNYSLKCEGRENQIGRLRRFKR